LLPKGLRRKGGLLRRGAIETGRPVVPLDEGVFD
jgi:hypothetical protein